MENIYYKAKDWILRWLIIVVFCLVALGVFVFSSYHWGIAGAFFSLIGMAIVYLVVMGKIGRELPLLE